MDRRRRRHQLPRPRDASVIATPVRSRPVTLLPSLPLVEDGRVFHPLRSNRPALNFRGRPARIIVADKRNSQSSGSPFKTLRAVQRSQTRALLAFASPSKTIVCVRRKTRRQVLAAKGRLGGRTRKPRRTWRSQVRC